jgi:type IV fimbrial biogenesis protein FimT
MRKTAGFTLVELMIVLLVAAILLGTAVPAMRTFIQNNRASAQANTLVSALNLARSEAVKANLSAFVSVNTPGNWAGGWTVFLDANDNGAPDGGEEVRVFGQLPAGGTLIPSGAVFQLEFIGTGTLETAIPGGGDLVFELRIPDCEGNQGRDISLNALGRVRVDRMPCA